MLADGRGAAPQFSFGPAAVDSGSAVGVTPSATMRQYRWRVPAEPDVEFRRPLIVNNERSSTETPAKSRTDSTICPTGVPAREPVLASD